MIATNSFSTFINQVCCILSQPILKRGEKKTPVEEKADCFKVKGGLGGKC